MSNQQQIDHKSSGLVALSKSAHQHIRIDTQKVEADGADLHMVPVVLSEFRKLIVQYPIVFSKNAQTGQFMCSALMGFEQGENLFWEKSGWQSLYIPLQVSRQPFFLGQSDAAAEGDNHIMCINELSPAICKNTVSANGTGAHLESLFDEQGNATAYLQKQQNTLSQLLDGEQQTAEFIQALIELDLLTAMSLDITFADSSKTTINGLYTIDEDKLAKLPAETLGKLQQADYLSAIYAMVHSTGHIYGLIDKKNQRLEKAKDWFKTA